MLPDTQTLLLRSGAAGPLLDALQDRRSREPVRSIIERLIGGRRRGRRGRGEPQFTLTVFPDPAEVIRNLTAGSIDHLIGDMPRRTRSRATFEAESISQTSPCKSSG